MKNGRGEEAPVPENWENCVEAVATVAETRAADQPGVLIQEWESVGAVAKERESLECEGEPREEDENEGET